MNKKNIILLFGGQSAEHKISLRSATTIYRSLDRDKYNIFAVGIDIDGTWFLHNEDYFDIIPTNIDRTNPVFLSNIKNKTALYSDSFKLISTIDFAFPIIHGTNGEDGTLQGFLTINKLPFIGPNLLSSAICMDKSIAKNVLDNHGLNTAKGVLINYTNPNKYSYDELKTLLSPTLYVKPCNMGSSVGISKVTNKDEFANAIKEAFLYDNKVLIERELKGREIECAVLGNNSNNIETSIIGEIIPKDFYSYDEKYVSSNDADLQIPAKLDAQTMQLARDTAKKAYLALECSVMARVDMFLMSDGKIFINEINTLPGFTAISMYPTLWQHSNLAIKDLLDKLIQLATERFEQENRLKKIF